MIVLVILLRIVEQTRRVIILILGRNTIFLEHNQQLVMLPIIFVCGATCPQVQFIMIILSVQMVAMIILLMALGQAQ